jgi:signal transduction histidine kinase
MKRGQETASPKDEDNQTTEAGADLAVCINLVFDGMTAGATPQRGYSATVEAAAHLAGGPASLWRLAKDSPVLLAAAGPRGETPGEDLLALMKETAERALSPVGDISNPRVDKGDARSHDVMCVLVEGLGENWGALVASPGNPRADLTQSMRCLARAAGLVAEKAALHDEVAHLRGKAAAAEGTRDPMARYARLGQLAGRAYDEIARIVDAVQKTMSRSLRAPDKAEIEEAIAELSRAKAILNEQLELARLEIPVLEMSNLGRIVQASVREIEDEVARRNLRLLKRLDPTPPPLLLDTDKIRMVFDKILAAAVSRTEPDGWLRIESEDDGEEVRVQVMWEEKATPGVAAHDMFVPFGSVDKGGVGLAVASQVIREHGGGISVRRLPSGTTALTMAFPIGANQDRRRRMSRRSGLDRRRPRSEDE